MKNKKDPSHSVKKYVFIAKEGDKIGEFVFIKNDLVGKNKIWIVKCVCGKEKVFWKYSAIFKCKTCGCGTDSAGLTKEQRRMLNSRLHSYKGGAKKRKIKWNLTYEKFVEITSKDCTYCGSKPLLLNYFENAPSLKKESPNRDWSKYTIYFNGIDRLDSSRGYFEENCVPCCVKCNRAKSDLTFNDFKTHIKKIHEWLNLKE